MKPAMRWIMLVLSTLSAGSAWAGHLEIGVGGTFKYHDEGAERDLVNIAWVEEGLLADEVAAGRLSGKALRPDRDGGDPDLGEAVHYLSWGKRLTWQRWFVGLAVAVVDQTSSRLSSTLEFKTQVGWAAGPVVLKLEHLSNGGFHGENRGENLAVIGWRF